MIWPEFSGDGRNGDLAETHVAHEFDRKRFTSSLLGISSLRKVLNVGVACIAKTNNFTAAFPLAVSVERNERGSSSDGI